MGAESINKIINTNNEVVIGISGEYRLCSEMKKILMKKKDDMKELTIIKNNGDSSLEDVISYREQEIINNYLGFISSDEKDSENGNWIPFDVINMNLVILGKLIRENDFEEFKEYLKPYNLPEEKIDLLGKKYFNDSIKDGLKSTTNYFEGKVPFGDNNENGCSEEEIKVVLRELVGELIEIDKENLFYAKLIKDLGNNIRFCGKVLKKDSDYFDGQHLQDIAKEADEKWIQHVRTSKDGRRICVYHIKTPLESLYLKQRHNYFLVSAEKDENNNEESSKWNQLYIEEYNKDAKGQEALFKSNISGCIQMADIHLVDNGSESTNNHLYYSIARYVTLMLHPGLFGPTKQERAMQVASNAKLNSNCISRQVGAVVTDENYSIKAIGWNDVAEGQIGCRLRSISCLANGGDNCRYYNQIYSEYEREDTDFRGKENNGVGIIAVNQENLSLSTNGLPDPFCFKDVINNVTGKKNQVWTRALHAEENAFLTVSKHGGLGVKGGVLFCTASPCELCSKKAYQLGISSVIYIDRYPGIAEKQIIRAGIEAYRPKMELYEGAIGDGYIRLYSPIIPYKDEYAILKSID